MLMGHPVLLRIAHSYTDSGFMDPEVGGSEAYFDEDPVGWEPAWGPFSDSLE